MSDRVKQGFRGRSSQPVTPSGERPSEGPLVVEKKRKDLHVDFADEHKTEKEEKEEKEEREKMEEKEEREERKEREEREEKENKEEKEGKSEEMIPQTSDEGYFDIPVRNSTPENPTASNDPVAQNDVEAARSPPVSRDVSSARSPVPSGGYTTQQLYTRNLRSRPPVPYVQSLKIWNGRIAHDKWLRVMVRPLILFAYPAVLWSSMVYALSVGWLIVLSEAVAEIYRSKESYNFSAMSTGLVYISPFVGGILGTAVAGKLSDIIVRHMTRRNGGIYEPEFRLVMAFPIAITTAIGLMGFGWSAQEKDKWIIPTVFFGILSFGCCLGSTTSITFCVDSYRQYAGEALVTLNFCKSMSRLLFLQSRSIH